ncbi:MAG TPA: hypothetical protein VGA50_12915 [Kiloniellales bacterium]
MPGKLRAYIRHRLRDSNAWLAVAFIVPWAVGAIWGLSPAGVWNIIQLIAFALALFEWLQIVVWKRREAVLERQLLEVLRPPSDRWKAAWMIPLTALLFVAELWVERGLQQTSLVNFGLTAFGISTMFSLWYAWSRPVRVTALGIVVGVELLPWSRIAAVTWDRVGEETTVRFDFGGAGHYWYGTKLRAVATRHQVDFLSGIVPVRLRVDEGLVRPEEAQPNPGLDLTRKSI